MLCEPRSRLNVSAAKTVVSSCSRMAELIDGHIRHHVHSATEREKATDELMEIVRSYLR
jgi:DNA-binding FrmR family transcriptional regulator